MIKKIKQSQTDTGLNFFFPLDSDEGGDLSWMISDPVYTNTSKNKKKKKVKSKSNKHKKK